MVGKEYRLNGFEKEEDTGLWAEGERVTLECRRLRDGELFAKCYSMIKSRRWAGHVAHVERVKDRFFLRKPEGNRPLGRPRYRWKMVLNGSSKAG
jgi:hypothetical protein